MPRTPMAIDDDDSPGGRVDERPPARVTVVTAAVLRGRAVSEVGIDEAVAVAGETFGSCCAPPVTDGRTVASGGGAVATVVGAAVVRGGVGGQIAVASAGPRGGGSVGSAEPSGCQRQPSTVPGSTCPEAGPTFEYDHFAPLPCQYDQYA